MTLAERCAEPVDEQVVIAEHLHVRVLDQLAGRSAREQRRVFGLPGIPDRVTAGNGLAVAIFGLGKKSPRTKNQPTKLSKVVLARGFQTSCATVPTRPLPPLDELQLRQSTRTLLATLRPPFDNGTMRSAVRSSVDPHSQHQGVREMAFATSARHALS